MKKFIIFELNCIILRKDSSISLLYLSDVSVKKITTKKNRLLNGPSLWLRPLRTEWAVINRSLQKMSHSKGNYRGLIVTEATDRKRPISILI